MKIENIYVDREDMLKKLVSYAYTFHQAYSKEATQHLYNKSLFCLKEVNEKNLSSEEMINLYSTELNLERDKVIELISFSENVENINIQSISSRNTQSSQNKLER